MTPRAPGPKGHPLHGSWPEFRQDPLAFLLSNTARYGDCFSFRLGFQRCFCVADPATIQAIFTDREGFADAPQPSRMETAYPRSLARLEGREHLERRRALAPAFRREAVLSCVAPALRAIEAKLAAAPTPTGTAAPLLPLLEDLSLRSAAALLMGDAAELVMEDIATAQPVVEAWLGGRADEEDLYLDARARLDAAIREAAAVRRTDRDVERVDALGLLVRAVDDGALDEQAMIDELVMMLITHVPTARSIAWALYELAKRPALQDAIHGELEPLVQLDAAVDPVAPRAPVLHATVLEALRMHPPVWVLVRKARRRSGVGPTSSCPSASCPGRSSTSSARRRRSCRSASGCASASASARGSCR